MGYFSVGVQQEAQPKIPAFLYVCMFFLLELNVDKLVFNSQESACLCFLNAGNKVVYIWA